MHEAFIVLHIHTAHPWSEVKSVEPRMRQLEAITQINIRHSSAQQLVDGAPHVGQKEGKWGGKQVTGIP